MPYGMEFFIAYHGINVGKSREAPGKDRHRRTQLGLIQLATRAYLRLEYDERYMHTLACETLILMIV
jgi:hypothetical protein